MAGAVAARRPPDRLKTADPVLLLPAAVLLGLLAAWGALSRGASRTGVEVDLAVAWAFAGAAVIALSRPALRRVGVLMGATSGAFLLGYLQLSRNSALWTIGWVLGFLSLGLLTQLVLSYPDGRVWSIPARLVVVVAYADAVGMALLTALFKPEPRNLLFVHAAGPTVDAINRATYAVGFVTASAVLVLVVCRLLVLRGVARRVALPLLAGAVLATPVFAIRSAAFAVGNPGLGDRLERTDQLATILIPLGFFAGLLWSRLRRTGASTLVVELRAGGIETLRDRLARALGDPTLEVVYWLDDAAGYVDDQGLPVQLPLSTKRAVTKVLADGAPVAALLHDPALLDEPDLIESVRATAGLVLENRRLAAEVRAQLAEVRASRARIVAAADDERRRLERDLHDGAQQQLVGLSLKLRLAQSGADAATVAALDQAQDDVEQALGELREFARGVHPSILREDGLDAAVEVLARRASLPVDVRGAIERRLPDAVELAAFFFISEALTNIAKHAAASQATLELIARDGLLTITVSDDGVGGADQRKGSGLAGLADRLAALDGTIALEDAAGKGTRLVARIPCGS
jgi:signal transduction histidine kinase